MVSSIASSNAHESEFQSADGTPLGKYNLLNKLALKYLESDDIREYPKAVAIFQYLHKLVTKYPELANEEIDKNIALAEAKFLSIATQKQISAPDELQRLAKMQDHRDELETHRKDTKKQLAALKNRENPIARSNAVEAIHEKTRKFFIREDGLVRQLLAESLEALGAVPQIVRENRSRPCEYAFFGMGSMSRGTMHPWSEMKFGILYEDGLTESEEKTVNDFFRNAMLLLQMKIINFGETSLEAMGIAELNNSFRDDLTTSGFSFYNPCELIGTVSKFAKYYQEPNNNQALVYDLSHMILITGAHKLLYQFQKRLSEHQPVIKQAALQLLKDWQMEQKAILQHIDKVVVALGDCLHRIGTTNWDLVRNLRGLSKSQQDDLLVAQSMSAELNLHSVTKSELQQAPSNDAFVVLNRCTHIITGLINKVAQAMDVQFAPESWNRLLAFLIIPPTANNLSNCAIPSTNTNDTCVAYTKSALADIASTMTSYVRNFLERDQTAAIIAR